MDIPLYRRTLLTAAAGAVTGSLITDAAIAQNKSPLSLQLGWFHSGDQLGEICAKHQGYYDAEGLDLRVQPGGPNTDGIAVVATGRCDLGQVPSSPSLMLAVAQGIAVRCFAVGAQQHPFTYFSLKRNPVREPKDLIGKTIGTQATAMILLRALLAKHGIAQEDVRVVAAGTDMSALVTGHVDVITSWLTNVSALRVLGDERVEMRLWDAGVRLYAHPYYTTERMLKARPELLAKFLRATARGWAFALDNREQAAEFVVKEFPGRNRRDELEVADVILRHAFGPNTKRNGWGAMEPALWQEQIDLYAGLKQFGPRVPKLDEVMTLDVLKATEGQRPKVG